ncbi:DNA-binding transcriptional LysR family regulator [Hydrogenophaga palleronii]|uniref:DNA-binding transcriptional LysR family regulator n=1 Tax=Hydrogenophaga palleronii TaxID=65655 RepID=A0ABU1WS04_9BURK|nr:LysR family transcriptional regulator [Hydrogenophaga palleronii]MDR7151741.1 DNA-binding transcriptional LysR family regulator [Hydrogenophaga palleronii]
MSRAFGETSLGSIELFCLAAELESFTGAAQQAGITPAAVSRAIGRLEERLGVRLFARSTRRVRLTDGGREYHAQCKQALAQLAEAERQLTGHQAAPAGLVRISAPTTFGHHRLLPLLPAFHARHPKVEVEVHLSNRNIDFTADGFDLAIRAREQADSGLVARKLMDAELTVVGTPQYLARCPAPASPADLESHECIQFILPRTGQRVPWRLRFDGEERDVQTAGSLTCSDDILGCATLARAGAGLVQTYRFIVEKDIEQGTLVEVLKPFAGASRPFSLIYPGRRHMPLRVRALADFLAASLQRGGKEPLKKAVPVRVN